MLHLIGISECDTTLELYRKTIESVVHRQEGRTLPSHIFKTGEKGRVT